MANLTSRIELIMEKLGLEDIIQANSNVSMETLLTVALNWVFVSICVFSIILNIELSLLIIITVCEAFINLELHFN